MGISPDMAVPSGMGIVPANDGTGAASGMAAFFARDEDDWKNQSVRNPMIDVFDPIGVFMTDFKSWVDAMVQAFGGNFSPLISLVQDVWDDIINPDWLDDVTGWSGFWENLAVNFEELLEALSGDYEGDDSILLGIQQIARTFRSVLSGGPLINLGQLTTEPINLLPSGSFDTESTVLEGEGWSWDDTTGRTAPGSARFVGTGDAGNLFSPAPAEVELGKSYSARCWVSWDGVVASGPAFTPFVRWSDSSGGVLSETALPAISSPSASSSWVELAAEVTAPASARWAHLAFQVESGVTGTVWWDDAGILAAQDSLPQSIIAGLTAALGQLGDVIEEALGWIKDLIEKLTGQARAALEDAIEDALTFGSQLKTILSGGTVASPLPNLDGSAVREAQTMIQQIAAIANGDPVTPVNGVVQAFKEGWSGLSSLTAGVESWLQDLIDAILHAIRKVPVVGGSLADIIAEVGGLDTRTTQAQQQAAAVQAGIIEGWSGGSSSGADQGVFDTMAAIKTAIANGYTVDTITSSGTWNKPSGITEIVVIAIGGGLPGLAGKIAAQSFADGGPGGAGGGYIAQQFDPEQVPSSVSCTIGGPGAVSKFGTLLTTSPGAGGIATAFGYSLTSSMPGNGGNGGESAYAANEFGYDGKDGGSTPIAAGGKGGRMTAYSHGVPGTDGAAASVATATKCGGGGGGGGGGSMWNYSTPSLGGNGGKGGYPGGGGGGGGGATKNGFGADPIAGTGGAGAAGVMWIFYR